MISNRNFTLPDSNSEIFQYQLDEYTAEIKQGGQVIPSKSSVKPTQDLRVDFSMVIKPLPGAAALTEVNKDQIAEFESRKIVLKALNQKGKECLNVPLVATNFNRQDDRISFTVNPLFKKMDSRQEVNVIRCGSRKLDQKWVDAETVVCSFTFDCTSEDWKAFRSLLPRIPKQKYTSTIKRVPVKEENKSLQEQLANLQRTHIQEIEKKNTSINNLNAEVLRMKTELQAAWILLQSQHNEIQQLSALVLDMQANPVKFLKERTLI